MHIEFIPLVSFVIITTFSPGPNNIASAAMGISYGYRHTLNFLFGIAAGFFIVMIGCAYLSSAILSVMPASEHYLRWLGAGYILWLAWGMLNSSATIDAAGVPDTGFSKGFLLQLVNPKVIVYGLTLFSTFLAAMARETGVLALFALAFALTAFTATSAWALGGAAIKSRLKNNRVRHRINLLLALMLVYTALDLAGIITILKRIIT